MTTELLPPAERLGSGSADPESPGGAPDGINSNHPWRRLAALGLSVLALSGSGLAAEAPLLQDSPYRPAAPGMLPHHHAAPSASPRHQETALERRVSSPLRVSGTRILTAGGQRFIPYGVSIMGGLSQDNYAAWTASTDAQIEAAARYWHVNTVRFQVDPDNLFRDTPAGDSYDPRFLRAMQHDVSLAKRLGLRSVINLQTEPTSAAGQQIVFAKHSALNPDQEDVRFWRVVAPAFQSQSNVIFDAFNEPRAGMGKLNPRETWRLWRQGGRYDHRTYVGMQAVVNTIRQSGARNLIWVEPPNMATAIDGFANDHIHGANIVDAYHHVDLNQLAGVEKNLARLAAKHAVVDGEWAEFASASRHECYASAYRSVPRYLQFLRRHHIGLIAWSLQYGSLVRGSARHQVTDAAIGAMPVNPAALRRPSIIKKNFSCSRKRLGQGAGQWLQRYFTHDGRSQSTTLGEE